MIGEPLTRSVGLSAPIMAGMSGKVTPVQILYNLFLSGVLIGLILGPLSLKLSPLSYGRRMGLLFFIFYGINTVIIIVETIFFTTMSGEKYTLVSNAISSAGMAALVAMLLRPSDSKLLFSTALRKAIAQRSWVSNLWRFGLAGFLYLPSRGTHIAAALNHVSHALPRRATLFLLSDFMDQNWERALKVTGRKHDVDAVPVIDASERELPSIGRIVFEDAETGELLEIDTSDGAMRQLFEQTAANRTSALRQTLRRCAVDSIEVQTDRLPASLFSLF